MNCIDARPMKFANLMAKLADERRAWMFLSNQGYGNHIFRFAENRGFPDSEKLCGFAPLRENLFREIVDGADDSITRILLENRRSFGFLVGVACKKMARRTNPHTWSALKESGELQERHVLMAMGYRARTGSIAPASDGGAMEPVPNNRHLGIFRHVESPSRIDGDAHAERDAR
jgi:hypothetical protein